MTQPVMFLTSTNEVNVDLAIEQINENLGLPRDNTTTWAIKRKAYDQDLWFFKMPPPNGYKFEDGTYFTQEQMMQGVINVDQEPFNPDWIPPDE